MRFVIFTHNYPPLMNPRAFRMRTVVKEYAQKSEVIVITAPIKGATYNENNIFRCGSPISNKPDFRNSLKKYYLIRLFHKMFWPDDKLFHQFFYLKNYFFKYRKKDDMIITVSNPFSSHLIGWILKKFWNHHWEVDIGDIYFGNQHHSMISKFFEKKILSNSDRIIVNSDSMRDFYISNYSVPVEKISVLPNGIHLDFSKIKHIPSEKIRLSFIGNTYRYTREAMQEFKILREIARSQTDGKIKIQLYGNQYYKIREFAKRHRDVIRIGYCKSEEELIQAYSNTDILINFANKNNPGLPSKLEEYVASGLPVINFVNSEEDPSYTFLNSRTQNVIHIKLHEANEALKYLNLIRKLVKK